MDVERIQKINNLALDLMRQGLAKDREDAIIQAEKVFRNNDSEDYNEIKNRMDNITFQENNNNQEDLGQERIKDILEQNTKFLIKKIGEFQEKINSMQREMDIIKNKVTYNEIPTVREILRDARSTAQSVETESRIENNSQQKELETNQQVPKNHPRSGNYNDNDVSIEKFFYMGSK